MSGELPSDEMLMLESGISIKLPNHPIASFVFRAMAANDYQEWQDFLNTAQSCSSLVDLGASGGFFSALFAATRDSSSRILSVEFDRTTLPVLEETRALNLKPNMEWSIDRRGVSDTCALLSIISTGYGAAIADAWSRESARDSARLNKMEVEEYEVEVDRLSSICKSYNFALDLLKIDIESYEYEVILSSEDILNQYKPRIHLELHLDMLRQRGKNPKDILCLLDRIGYRLTGSKASLSAIEKIQSEILRLGLTLEG